MVGEGEEREIDFKELGTHAVTVGLWVSVGQAGRLDTRERFDDTALAQNFFSRKLSFCFFKKIFLKFLLLFSYSCMPFLPIPPPHPS